MPFIERYKSGNTPWEINRPDKNLIAMVQTTPIKAGKALDIGCGTGNNAIWLQQQGFQVLGIDGVDLAVEQARLKAQQSQSDCLFLVGDFLQDNIPNTPFDLAFDRGCFHHCHEGDRLDLFASKVYQCLHEDGLWLSLAGSTDETREGPGPPQLSAKQIVDAVEPMFEILSLVASHFDSDQKPPAKNWVCLMRKRNQTAC